jgi:hypothetical protein
MVGEGLGEGGKNGEESKGNSMDGSPSAGTWRGGRNSWSTPAAASSVTRQRWRVRVRRAARRAARRLPFIGARARGCLGTHAQVKGPAAARPGAWLAWPMGLGGPGGWASAGAGGPERVGPSGSARSRRIVFFSFFQFIFNARNNSR